MRFRSVDIISVVDNFSTWPSYIRDRVGHSRSTAFPIALPDIPDVLLKQGKDSPVAFPRPSMTHHFFNHRNIELLSAFSWRGCCAWGVRSPENGLLS